MILPNLLPGTLIKRYKRFLADIELDCGTTITAHCANSGSMKGLCEPGYRVWCSQCPEGSKRKLQYTWELVELSNTFVGVNTHRPNAIVAAAITAGKIQALQGYASLRQEVSYASNCRIDILLENPNGDRCFVEVKSVTLKQQNLAQFPDAVTQRGTKHQHALAGLIDANTRAVVFYLVQRHDCEAFQLECNIDPQYCAASAAAQKQGVEVICYQCHITPQQIVIDIPLTVIGF